MDIANKQTINCETDLCEGSWIFIDKETGSFRRKGSEEETVET